MNQTWDADRYASGFSFVPQYGAALLDLLKTVPGGTVLDLGCGNGSLTALLRDHAYLVQGMDASVSLLAAAARQYPDIPFRLGDATDFTLPEPVDAVFSNAVFHWIDADRQPDMIRCIHDALKPGGELVFEMGGKGNNALIHNALARAFDRRGYPYKMPFCFPSIAEYAALLEQAGLQVRTALLFDRPTPLKGENGLLDWMEMFLSSPFQPLPDPEEARGIRREAVEELEPVLQRNGTWYCDYVRLRMRAVRV